MKCHSQVAAFILAGGVSSRMGRSKGSLEFAGVPLIVRMVRLVEPLVREVAVVGSSERYAALGLRVIEDQSLCGPEEPSPGPLVGIATALNTSQAPWNLILACDLPYLSAVWVDWLLSRSAQSNADVLMPQTAHGVEPLAALYRRECVSLIDAALRRGVRKITEALTGLRVALIDAVEWQEFDPHGHVLTNMNTPADYEEAQKWWQANKPTKAAAREAQSLRVRKG